MHILKDNIAEFGSYTPPKLSYKFIYSLVKVNND